MYQAKLHPEQYSNTFSDEQVKRLHDAMMYVCDTAVQANGDSDSFPQDWLMKHRWGKGKKEASKLPTGEKITFLKVGGRTSAIVPSVQKKTAAVAGDVSDNAEAEDSEANTKPKKSNKRKAQAVKKEDEEVEEKTPAKTKGELKNVKKVKEETEDASKEDAPAKLNRASKKVKEQVEEEMEAETGGDIEEQQPAKKRKTTANGTAKKNKAPAKEGKTSDDTTGRRRSGRLSR